MINQWSMARLVTKQNMVGFMKIDIIRLVRDFDWRAWRTLKSPAAQMLVICFCIAGEIYLLVDSMLPSIRSAIELSAKIDLSIESQIINILLNRLYLYLTLNLPASISIVMSIIYFFSMGFRNTWGRLVSVAALLALVWSIALFTIIAR